MDRRTRSVRLDQNGVPDTAGYTTKMLHFVTYVCIKAEGERKFKVGTKQEPAFISRGFTNWKDATVVFNKHLKSDYHREAVEIHELPKKTGDMGEKLNTEHKKEKELNREMFRRILQNVCYLSHQGQGMMAV